MTVALLPYKSEFLRAITDMGSNGIRFSISSLQPPTQRVMPTLYQHRVGISLYDAQYTPSGERVPIDEKTIAAVVIAYKQFKRTCMDYGVPSENVTVLATEATRTALNSAEFRQRIKDEVGWTVTMLSKEEEGRVGALGVASSLPEVSGLVMDLGGGSTQLSWLIKGTTKDDVQMPDNGSVSMPYGAAALSRRLAEAERNGTVAELQHEIKQALTAAYSALKVPTELEARAAKDGGVTLYLSGGGFRGWGYVLMSRNRIDPYPIPVINGYRASRRDFVGIEEVKAAAADSLSDEEESIFRVSDRRAGQVPAVALLVNVLAEVLPQVKEVRFCQGGVREGYLFASLPNEIRAQHPLVVATQPFDLNGKSEVLASLLESSLPAGSTENATDDYKSVLTTDLFDTMANMMYYHSSHSKELQATAALRSTTSGVLAGIHGVLHESRTLIALLLCARWGGNVPPNDEKFKQSLEKLVPSSWTLWWVNYIGAVAALIGSVFPAGFVAEEPKRLALRAIWNADEKQRPVLTLLVSLPKEIDRALFDAEAKDIEKVGKRKRWIGGRDGAGHRVAVEFVD
jgi:retrograde regulation protein 2